MRSAAAEEMDTLGNARGWEWTPRLLLDPGMRNLPLYEAEKDTTKGQKATYSTIKEIMNTLYSLDLILEVHRIAAYACR